MGKFIFPMEKILNVKRKLERQQQLELGKAMQKLSGAMQTLQVLDFKQKDALENYQKKAMSGKIFKTEMKSLGEHVNYFHNEYKQQEKQINRLEKEVEQAREKLQEAVKVRKTYEILREKAFEIHLEEEKLAEAKLVDEIVSYKYRE